jgi:hypothetical protein
MNVSFDLPANNSGGGAEYLFGAKHAVEANHHGAIGAER